MTIRTALVAALCLTAGAAPSAAWTTHQGPGEVFVQHETPEYIVELRCQAGRTETLDFTLARTRGRNFGDVRSVMLWVEYPDGRLGRHPIDVTNNGQYVTGAWYVSDLVLEEFRQGKSLSVALDGSETVLKTDMDGTGAARLAFKERCGM